MRNRFLLNYIGAERAGKTYHAQKLAEKYHKKGGTIFAYNVGKPSDFPSPEYEEIEILNFGEHLQKIKSKEKRKLYKMYRTIYLFRYRGKIYHFKNFNTMFKGKKVKMYRVVRNLESPLFLAIFKYVSNTLLILDDCKAMFRSGLSDQHIQLFNRKNHTGRESELISSRAKGLDVLCLFHHLDHVPSELWDYTQYVIFLRFVMKPKFHKFENEKLKNIFINIQNRLLKSPKYTALQVDVQVTNKVIDVTIK